MWPRLKVQGAAVWSTWGLGFRHRREVELADERVRKGILDGPRLGRRILINALDDVSGGDVAIRYRISAISRRCASMISSAILRTRGSRICARSEVMIAIEWCGIIARM
jgi:hypothetical protein